MCNIKINTPVNWFNIVFFFYGRNTHAAKIQNRDALVRDKSLLRRTYGRVLHFALSVCPFVLSSFGKWPIRRALLICHLVLVIADEQLAVAFSIPFLK